jgi:CHASE3 domain sensor protein
VIESRPEPTTTSKVIGAELDNLIKMEVAVIDKLGWYSDIRSNIQPRSSFLNLEPIPEQEDTVFRDNKAKLAEQTYFDYYQKELDEYHQEIVTSIENSYSQNKRLLSLIRDRINAIGTDENVRLQKSIYILTFFMAVVSAISLVTTIINIS